MKAKEALDVLNNPESYGKEVFCEATARARQALEREAAQESEPRLPPEMDVVGFLGFQEEGSDVYLFQCPKCKAVVMNHDVKTFCDCYERGGE